MTDIVKKLRDDASITSEFAMTQDDYTEAADTIETLRQRVKELEESLSIAINSGMEQIAALKQQGKPVGRYVGLNTIEWLVDGYPKKLPLNAPLYTAPPTCFSAADMADAQAKAFKEGRFVGYNKGHDDE